MNVSEIVSSALSVDFSKVGFISEGNLGRRAPLEDELHVFGFNLSFVLFLSRYF